MQWLNIFYCFINYHFGFIYFLKIANWRQKGKYKNNSAIFLSPKMLQPIILETTLNFIFGLQLSSKWSPNGLLFTSKVVSIWSPMETFSSLPISSQPCYSTTQINVCQCTQLLTINQPILFILLVHCQFITIFSWQFTLQ